MAAGGGAVTADTTAPLNGERAVFAVLLPSCYFTNMLEETSTAP